MSKKWTRFSVKELRMIRTMIAEGMFHRDIGLEIGRSSNMIAQVAHEMGWKSQTKIAVTKRFNRTQELYESTKYDEERRKVWRFFQKVKPRRIIEFADAHYPFQDEEVLDAAFKIDADVAVIVGDGTDYYSLSRFKKDKLVSFTSEIADYEKFLRRVTRRYKHVVMLEANHELRLMKMLQDRLEGHADVVGWLKDKADPLNDLSKKYGFMLVHDWWFKIQSAVFAHPDWFTNKSLQTAENTLDWFFKHERMDWEVLVNGHTHKQGFCYKYGKCLIETGCMCKKMDYIMEGKKRLEMHKGFWVLDFDRQGHFLFNKSKPYHFSNKRPVV